MIVTAVQETGRTKKLATGNGSVPPCYLDIERLAAPCLNGENNMYDQTKHENEYSYPKPIARARIGQEQRVAQRHFALIGSLAILALLTLYGCGGGGTTSTSEPTTPGAPQSTTETTPTPSPSPQNTVQQVPTPRPVAPKPTPSKKEPAKTPGPQPIIVGTGTVIEVTIDQSLSSKTNNPGDHFDASVVSPVTVDDIVVVPAGTKASGTITETKSAGRVQGSAALKMRLDSFTVQGVTYKIRTAVFEETGAGRGKRTGIGAGVGAAAGAVIGAIAGGGKGAAIGAGTGAGAGTAGAVLTGERDITVPAETRVSFTLSEPVSIKGR
ncbi:MAG: hypothetical protein LAN18_07460 [Acidobacteriia bacterium]|nr:hypothetical protein [Terriglobia bacterium]